MVARVGQDLFGPATIRNFESQGIDTTHVKIVPGTSSGVAPIFVESNGQNRIIVVKGANDRLMPADVEEARPMLEQTDCIVLQFEIPLETVAYTIRFASTRGIRCILNPAPAQPVDMQAVSPVDYFTPNETEAESISGMPVRSIEEAHACGRALVDRGFERVIITLGEQGALLATKDGTDLVPPYKVPTKDSTGAGDAFVGSFAVFLGEGLAERDAIARANLYAALSTMNVGTQKSFVSRECFEQEWRARATAA
jgi:ribokinase